MRRTMLKLNKSDTLHILILRTPVNLTLHARSSFKTKKIGELAYGHIPN